MSYCRNPYYVYSNGDELFLDSIYVKEDIINVFLYDLYTNKREELLKRVQCGKEILDKNRALNEYF